MRTKLIYPAIAVLLAFAVTGCQKREASRKPIAGHVILVGFDGWGAYSVPGADMPNLKKLMQEGSYTLSKRSVLPSSSAVNWASMFMGAGPELHGYTEWDSSTPDLPSRVVSESGTFPTVFRLLRDAEPDAEIGCFYEWDGIKYLVDTLALSKYWHAPDYINNPDTLCSEACRYIREKKPRLFAVCFDNPDHVGHAAGHDTPEYYAELSRLDSILGKITGAAVDAGIYDDCIVIVTSDHGGIGTGHGGKTMAEMETPFVIAGKGVRQGGEFDESMMQYDCASTIAWIFGLEQPQVWVGRPMKQIFSCQLQ